MSFERLVNNGRAISFFFLLAMSLLVFFPDERVQANEQESLEPDIDSLIHEQLETLNFDEVKQFWDSIVTEYGGFLAESQKGSFFDFVKADKSNPIEDWILGGVKFIFYELVANGKLLGSLILLAVFAVLLQTIQNAFEFHT